MNVVLSPVERGAGRDVDNLTFPLLFHELTEEQHLCFLNTVLPQLTGEGIHLVRPEEMTNAQEQCLEDFFHKTLYPIVTPLAIDPGHPFPYLTNRSLSLIVSLRAKAASPLPYTELSIVNIPAQVVPRFVQLPAQEGQYAFMNASVMILRCSTSHTE